MRTGEVLTTVTASKTIASKASAQTHSGTSRSRTCSRPSGFTTNEPEQVALQQAIEKPSRGWCSTGSTSSYGVSPIRRRPAVVCAVLRERDGVYTTPQVVRAMQHHGELKPAPSPGFSQNISREKNGRAQGNP